MGLKATTPQATRALMWINQQAISISFCIRALHGGITCKLGLTPRLDEPAAANPWFIGTLIHINLPSSARVFDRKAGRQLQSGRRVVGWTSQNFGC
jgi:hypothetical protein